MGQLAPLSEADVIGHMSEMIELCLTKNKPAAESIEIIQARANFGPNKWQPLAPPRHSFGTYYLALANALLFVSDIELAEIKRADLKLRDLLVSIRARWSQHQHRFTYSVVAGVYDCGCFTTAGIAHDKIQAELRGDPMF
jgi:hypothetical protein